MSENIKISVITPSFNQAEYIERTLNSVLFQETDFRFELIVMDGGSTDGTLEILKKYQEKIRWISEKDDGQADAINKGLKLATGEILAYLNSDDVYLPGTLQRVADLLDDNPDKEWLYGQCNIIDENDREIRKGITRYKNWSGSEFSYNRLLTENYISQPAVFFRRTALDIAGDFNPDLHYAMDYDMWLRLSQISPPIVFNDYLASFRMHGASKSTLNSGNLFREQYMVHKEYDQRRYLLFRHRVRILQISLVYWLLEVGRRR
jgi:glycosyltransferase involved in cell wall biosynthesis